VLAGESISLEEQLAQWEQRKALEKLARVSVMDDIPTGQPALALAQKVLARADTAGIPADLIPGAITSVSVSADVDAENALRSAVLEFMDDVRVAERWVAAARRSAEVAEELDAAPLSAIDEDEWRNTGREAPLTPKPTNRRKRPSKIRHFVDLDPAAATKQPEAGLVSRVCNCCRDRHNGRRVSHFLACLSVWAKEGERGRKRAKEGERRRCRRQSKIVEPQNDEVSPSRSPGGQANTAELVGRTYSFSASLREISDCMGINCVTGLRTKAMKNSPASR